MSVPPYQDQDPSTPPYGMQAADTGYAEYPAYPPAPPPMPYPYLGNPYPPYPPYPPPRPTNALAIASLICAFLFAPLGIVFGHLSLSQIKRSGEEGRGLAVAGLVIGYLITIGTILALIAGALLFTWAARVVRENTYPDGVGVMRPRAAAPLIPGDRTLPPLTPRGTVAMANSGPDSNGNQFFVVYRDAEPLPTWTVLGRVDDKACS